MAEFSSNGITVEFDDNSEEVLEALKNAVERGLKACGEKAVGYAQDLVPVDTGNLRNHIDYEVDGDDCIVGVTHMNPPYGIYIEFGTGQHAETGGRKTPWVYQDVKGNWHLTNGYEPHPFIRPAAEKHAKEYQDILKDSLLNA